MVKGGINMKRFLVMFSLMVVLGIGLVSAAVDFGMPAEGVIVNEDIDVSWENGTYATSNLMYHVGACDGTLPGTLILSGITADGSDTWDISGLDDGAHCLKIADGSDLHGNVSVIIDTTAPTIEFLDSYYYNATGDVVTVNFNITDAGGIALWVIDFGEGNETNGTTDGVLAEGNTYSAEGSYVVTLTVTDNAGNVAEVTVPVIISEAGQDWVIPLSDDGMNVFSIPLMPESTAIEDVLPEEISDKADKIWSYQGGSWKYNTPTSTAWSTSSARIQDIVPGYGYILFMDEDSVFYGKGKVLGAEIPTQEIELVPGWNFVGLFGLTSTASDEALSSVDLGDSYRWNQVLSFNGVSWSELAKYSDVAPANMTFTDAYWVSVITNDGPIYL